ncbi:MAG: hypothetical protein ACLFS0_07840 [Bacteroidales bacterium]
MKRTIIWILAVAAMALSSTLHAQRALPDSIMFEGINLDNTCYDEIVATFGEPDEYRMTPGDSPVDGDRETFIYNFPGPDALLGIGELRIIIVGGELNTFILMGSEYKLFSDINGGVGPGDPIGWFAQNNFTLGPPEGTVHPGVYQRHIIFQPDIDYITFRVREANDTIVSVNISTL